MSHNEIRIFPIGDHALTIEFGCTISETLNDRVHALARYFSEVPFPGFVESVPAYSSLTLFYNLNAVRSAFPEFMSAFEAVSSLVMNAVNVVPGVPETETRLIEIPVLFGGSDSPDLDDLAAQRKLLPDDVVDIFLGRTYRVYMLGFLPGFAYMGEIDSRISTPRKSRPARVRKGGVGIAGSQTGVYPVDSPGGWRIIGRTDVEMFDLASPKSSLLRPGDRVKFIRA